MTSIKKNVFFQECFVCMTDPNTEYGSIGWNDDHDGNTVVWIIMMRRTTKKSICYSEIYQF